MTQRLLLLRVVVFASLALGCYRKETPTGQALLCPPEAGLQRVQIPFEISGMGSAHYPGPPYSYESFDVLTFLAPPDARSASLVEVRRYRGEWALEKVRGEAVLRDRKLVIKLEYWTPEPDASAGSWESYPLNGEHQLVDSNCRTN